MIDKTKLLNDLEKRKKFFDEEKDKFDLDGLLRGFALGASTLLSELIQEIKNKYYEK